MVFDFCGQIFVRADLSATSLVVRLPHFAIAYMFAPMFSFIQI